MKLLGDAYRITPIGKSEAIADFIVEKILPTPGPPPPDQTADWVNETIGSADLARAIDASGKDLHLAACWARIGLEKITGFMTCQPAGAARGAVREGRLLVRQLRNQRRVAGATPATWSTSSKPPVPAPSGGPNPPRPEPVFDDLPWVQTVKKSRWNLETLAEGRGVFRRARTKADILVSDGEVGLDELIAPVSHALLDSRKVVVLAGTHGDTAGGLRLDKRILEEIKKRYKDVSPDVFVPRRRRPPRPDTAQEVPHQRRRRRLRLVLQPGHHP